MDYQKCLYNLYETISIYVFFLFLIETKSLTKLFTCLLTDNEGLLGKKFALYILSLSAH